MERVALHTKLAPGKIEEYEALHAEIPAQLDKALRHAGVAGWWIWRDGLHLFHVVDVLDFAAMTRALGDDPADVEWQKQVAPLLQVNEPSRRLSLVWKLPQEPTC